MFATSAVFARPSTPTLALTLALTAWLGLGAQAALAQAYPQPWPGLGKVALGDATEQDFYNTPVSDLASLPNGTLIRYSRMDHTDDGANLDPARFKTTPTFGGEDNAVPFTMWRVIYTTRGATLNPLTPGRPLLASGIVMVPTAAWAGAGPRPIVIDPPKTQGLGTLCPPSKAMQAGTEEPSETRRALVVLKKGYALAITDYDGYTGGEAHSYLVGQVNGRATLDLARALQQLPGTGLSTTAPVAIWGYSEGGTSAAWAGQLQPSYYPTMNLKGVATGGLVADMLMAARATNATAFSGLTMATTWGYKVAYPSLWFNVNSSYWTRLLGSDQSSGPLAFPPKAADSQTSAMLHKNQCVNQLGLYHSFLDIKYRNRGASPTDLPEGQAGYTVDQLTSATGPTPDWVAAMEANKIGNMKINVPTYLYYGVLDPILPQANFTEAYARLCARGTVVQKNWYLGGHQDTSDYAFNDVLRFLDERFTGSKAPVNSCN
ncbi:MAG: lipase family protein [Aquabacterium sp.]